MDNIDFVWTKNLQNYTFDFAYIYLKISIFMKLIF